MSGVTERADARRARALEILDELKLMERWSAFGRPVLVGATAYDLMVSPDIDLEIWCDQPRIADGFAILAALAEHPRVTRARFGNHLSGPDQGLYWSLRYEDEDGTKWKMDMWSFAGNHPGPLATHLVEPMRAALTGETREAILTIKEGLLGVEPSVGSIWVYRAVLDHGVRSLTQFRAWYEQEHPRGLTYWQPRRSEERPS